MKAGEKKDWLLRLGCLLSLLLPSLSRAAVGPEYTVIQQPSPYQLISQSQDASIDSPLEAEIEKYIKQLRRRRILSHTDKTSFVVYDISNQKKVVSINEDRPLMAASLIKNTVDDMVIDTSRRNREKVSVRHGRFHKTRT